LLYQERMVIFVTPNVMMISRMKTFRFFTRFLVLLLFGFVTEPAMAVGTDDYITISGKAVESSRKKALCQATVQLPGANISTITNSDGVFVLKIPLYIPFTHLEIKHIGYSTLTVNAEDIDLNKQNRFVLTAEPDKEVSVFLPPDELIGLALENIKQNYAAAQAAKVAFFREQVKKKRKNRALTEVVLDINKASYSSMSPDLVRLYRGRKITNYKPADTLLFKFKGGIIGLMSMDIAKQRELFFNQDLEEEYKYKLEGMTSFDGQPHYIISFNQSSTTPDMLYRGKIYLDAENYAVTRVVFNMNVENLPDAARFFIREQPKGVKIDITEAAYQIDFRNSDNGYTFHHGRLELKYRCKWDKKAIRSTYTIAAELIVTNEVDQHLVVRDNLIQVHAGDILAEKIEDFENNAFWGAYNIIEPDGSIEKATTKLLRAAKKNERRNR